MSVTSYVWSLILKLLHYKFHKSLFPVTCLLAKTGEASFDVGDHNARALLGTWDDIRVVSSAASCVGLAGSLVERPKFYNS